MVNRREMFIKKVIIFILLTAVLVSGKAYCQEEIKSNQIKTIAGGVSKVDDESSVINVRTGSVAKQTFLDAHFNAELIWGELIKSGYIDPNGTIQAQFYELDKSSNMLLPRMSNAKKKVIYNIFQKALIDNGIMVFYISLNSNLLRGTHHIALIEIEQGDPVTIQYDSSSTNKNNIICLVDNKSDDN
jgi:hypothetical protein